MNWARLSLRILPHRPQAATGVFLVARDPTAVQPPEPVPALSHRSQLAPLLPFPHANKVTFSWAEARYKMILILFRNFWKDGSFTPKTKSIMWTWGQEDGALVTSTTSCSRGEAPLPASNRRVNFYSQCKNLIFLLFRKFKSTHSYLQSCLMSHVIRPCNIEYILIYYVQYYEHKVILRKCLLYARH